MWGAYLCVACLSNLTIEHASLSRRRGGRGWGVYSFHAWPYIEREGGGGGGCLVTSPSTLHLEHSTRVGWWQTEHPPSYNGSGVKREVAPSASGSEVSGVKPHCNWCSARFPRRSARKCRREKVNKKGTPRHATRAGKVEWYTQFKTTS